MPEVLTKPHPLVKATRTAARDARKRPDGRLMLTGAGHLGLEVSRGALGHALPSRTP